MKLEVKYDTDSKPGDPLYRIIFTIIKSGNNSKENDICFVKTSEYSVDINQLNSKDELEALEVKFIEHKNKALNKIDLIPVGIVCNEDDYCEKSLRLIVDLKNNDSDLIQVIELLENIKYAIKVRFKLNKIKYKFQNRQIETVDID